MRRIDSGLRFACLVLSIAWLMVVSLPHPIHAATLPTRAPVPFRPLTTVTLPDIPATPWCYDTAMVHDGISYLADNTRAGIDLIQDRTVPTFQGSIGQGQFTGPAGCTSFNFDQEGPEGLVIAQNQLFASNGDSSVRVYSLATGQFITRIPTGGHLRADEETYDAYDHLVIVANGSERDFSQQAAPFLSFITTQKEERVVKTLRFPHADALEQPIWNPSDGRVYLAVPASDQHPGGEVDVIDPHSLRVTSIATPACGDAGLAFASREVLAVGCSNGAQIVLNVRTHQMTRIAVTAVDIVAASSRYLFYASYGNATHAPQLAITDLQGHLLQTVPTSSESHTVSVDAKNGHVFVPLDRGSVEILAPTLPWDTDHCSPDSVCVHP